MWTTSSYDVDPTRSSSYNIFLSHDATQRNSKRYTHRQHVDMCTAGRAFLFQHVVLELIKHVAGGVVFTNDVPVRF
jgi:hypothetical protein